MTIQEVRQTDGLYRLYTPEGCYHSPYTAAHVIRVQHGRVVDADSDYSGYAPCPAFCMADPPARTPAEAAERERWLMSGHPAIDPGLLAREGWESVVARDGPGLVRPNPLCRP